MHKYTLYKPTYVYLYKNARVIKTEHILHIEFYARILYQKNNLYS